MPIKTISLTFSATLESGEDPMDAAEVATVLNAAADRLQAALVEATEEVAELLANQGVPSEVIDAVVARLDSMSQQTRDLVVADTPAPAPTLTAIAPTEGSVAGSTTVTLTGTGFVDGAQAMFGADMVAATFVSATELTAVTPAHATAEAVDVMVHNPDGQSVTLSAAFTYA